MAGRKPRISPSGPLDGESIPPGTADGQVPTWDNTAKDYVPQIPAGSVSSVFGRTGAVVAESGDYNSDEVTNASGVPGTTVSDALETLAAAIPPPAAVLSVFARTGNVSAQAGDYAASEVSNDSGVPGATVKDALDGLAASNITNDSSIPGTTVKDALNNIVIERLPTQMALTEVFRQAWLPVTQSGVVNPAYQTARLQPPGLLWVNDPFTDTTFARFTQITEAALMTFTLPGSTAVLTSPATAGSKMSLIREGVALGMPHVFGSIRVVSRTGTIGAYSAVLLGVVKDSNNYIVANWNHLDGTIQIQTKIAGVNNFDAGVNLPTAGVPLTLAFSIVGNWMTIYQLPESGTNTGLWQKVTAFNLVSRVDFKAQDMSTWFQCFGFATPGTNLNTLTLDDFKVSRFGGVGIRDICIVTHEDGSPSFASPTQVRALATLAGPSGGISEASEGCFLIDLEKKEFTQTGVIMVSRGGKIQNDHADMMILEDNGDQHFLASSWGDTPTPVRVLYKFVAAGTDLMNGSHVVAAVPLTLPNPGGLAVDYYDPFLIHKAGTWYLAYTVSSPTTGSPFFPALASSPDLATWAQVGFDTNATRYEGTRILLFQGQSYVLTGGQFNMRMYDLTMTYVGIVNCISPGDGTTQPHAMVFPYNNLDVLITFDGTKWPTVGGIDFSWGSIHWYASPRY